MDRHKLSQLHGAATRFSVWVWAIAVIAAAGIVVSVIQKSAVGILTAGFVLLIVAKHLGLAAVLLGPMRIVWWKMFGKRRRAARQVDAAAIMADEGMDGEPLDALRLLGHRLLGEFRLENRRLKALKSGPKSEPAAAEPNRSGGVPDMKLVESLADWMRAWETAGKAKVENPRAVAGLLVTSMYGIAAIETTTGKSIMDEAVDGFAAAIWQGLTPRP